jgi:hypothetical protein
MPTPKQGWYHKGGRLVKRYYAYNYSKQNKKDLRSKKWKALKQKVIAHYGSCALCGVAKKAVLQPHHKFYHQSPHRIYDYTVEEMAVLCRNCHKRIHGKK